MGKTFMLSLKDLVVTPDRGRKKFTRIMELADSIKRFGLIHPIVVAAAGPDRPNKFMLVAGERRYRGAILAGCGEVIAILREDSASTLAEIELEENVCRVDISFEEEGTLLAKIQERKKAEDPTWGIPETAQMTNRSVGDVSGKIAVAKEFKDRPDLKEACANLPYTAAVKMIKQKKEAEKTQRLVDQGQIKLTTELLHGDCRKLIASVATGSVDLLVTDPPYGIEKMENLRSGNDSMPGHQLMSDTHNLNLDEVIKLLRELAPELHRVLSPSAHFYMFCGFQYVGQFIDALSPWLEFQPPLVMWDRGKPSSPGYGYNYLSRAEAIIYGCRPPRGRRLNENMYNIIPCTDVPKNLRMYPTEKPVPLLQVLIKQSSSPGQLVLDPFAGSASTLVAAKETGRRALGFEIDREAFLRAQQRLQGTKDD